MCLVGYAGKNVCKAGKTSSLFSGDASGANRCAVVAHCAPSPWAFGLFSELGLNRVKKKKGKKSAGKNQDSWPVLLQSGGKTKKIPK